MILSFTGSGISPEGQTAIQDHYEVSSAAEAAEKLATENNAEAFAEFVVPYLASPAAESVKGSGVYTVSGLAEASYRSLLDIGGTGIMGYIEIPRISVSLPIYHGVDDSVLQIAVGHIEWSSLPVGGEGTHCVLSGHRGLPSSTLFTHLDRLQEGDVFMLRVLDEVYLEIQESGAVADIKGISFYKADMNDNGRYLPGAEFRLYGWDSIKKAYLPVADSSGNEVFTTDASGRIAFTFETVPGLSYNRAYRLVETKAPDGYFINKAARDFYIKGGDEKLYPLTLPSDFAGHLHRLRRKSSLCIFIYADKFDFLPQNAEKRID